MAEFTAKEKEVLLGLVEKIHTYKIMQALGFHKLSKRVVDERIKHLLEEIGSRELDDARSWSKRIERLAGEEGKSSRALFLAQKVTLMMGILGTRGFFEWAIIAEDESVEDLAIRAASVGDLDTMEDWTRIAADERMHIAKIKKEVLGMEGWEMGGGGGVRDVIFGANDGLVSILALVAGVYGASTESHSILIAGIAGAVAGAISMGAGAYLSAKSENEVTEKESERKGIKRKSTHEEEKERLVKFYMARGFKRQDAEAVSARIAQQVESKEPYTIGEDIGLTSEGSWSPIKAALFTGLTFAIASVIPILPFAFMEVNPAVITAAIATIGCLFIVGASKTIFSRKGWVRSGVGVLSVSVRGKAGGGL